MFNQSISISGRSISKDDKPYVIAELSANHNGKLDTAIKAIDAAKATGVDAIKLQTYTADTITMDCDEPDFRIRGGLWDGYKLYDLYKIAETPYEWHSALFEHARSLGITMFSTPFDETAVDLLEGLNTPAYKIASFEIVDLPLIKYVAMTGKPIIMSTGMASETEIEEAVTVVRDAGCRDLALLHCISSYPAPVDQSNLRQMRELSKRFGTVPGLSDHTLGTTVSVAAVALGACIIEKHFTLSREDEGPDSEFSLEPDDFVRLCTDTRDAWLALGRAGFECQKAETNSKLYRRSIYFVRDLPAGAIVTSEDIRRIRPGTGLAPKYFDQLIGKKLNSAVARGTATSWDVFDE